MDAKTFLMEYERADRRAKRCLEEYEDEAAMIKELARDRSIIENQPGKEEHKRRLASMIQHAGNVKAAAAEAAKKREEVRSIIDKVPGLEGDVIRARHIEGLTWDDIADKLYYSYAGIFKAYGRGLKIVQDMLNAADKEGEAATHR